jgi:hypothetical protein
MSGGAGYGLGITMIKYLVDPTADLISVLKLRVLGELWFFAEAGRGVSYSLQMF